MPELGKLSSALLPGLLRSLLSSYGVCRAKRLVLAPAGFKNPFFTPPAMQGCSQARSAPHRWARARRRGSLCRGDVSHPACAWCFCLPSFLVLLAPFAASLLPHSLVWGSGGFRLVKSREGNVAPGLPKKPDSAGAADVQPSSGCSARHGEEEEEEEEGL